MLRLYTYCKCIVTVMSDDHVSGDPPEPLRWYTEKVNDGNTRCYGGDTSFVNEYRRTV